MIAGAAHETTVRPSSRSSVSPRLVAATVAGNALEFYDFLTYSFFAVYIGRAFFPAESPYTSLLISVGIFGVGFLFRPLGGIIIGAYADRAGRRPAMLLTILLITVGTIGLALTPSYASIGIAAPIIVVGCRVVQGFALGGEVGPASSFLVEIAPAARRAYYASWQFASQGIAVLAAGGIGLGLSLVLNQAQLGDWGWRVPFILCLGLIPLAIYLRQTMPETLHAHPSNMSAAPVTLAGNSGLLTLSVLVIMGGTVSTYVGNYMTTYAIATLKMAPSIALSATVVNGLTIAIFSLIGGWLADRFGRRPTVIWPRVLLVLIVLPAFWWLNAAPSLFTLLAATSLISALTALSAAPSLALIPELLPGAIRSTGLSIAYALGVSLFGGTTQFIITWLIGVTGDPISPAWYVVVTSIITCIATWMLPETANRPLVD